MKYYCLVQVYVASCFFFFKKVFYCTFNSIKINQRHKIAGWEGEIRFQLGDELMMLNPIAFKHMTKAAGEKI